MGGVWGGNATSKSIFRPLKEEPYTVTKLLRIDVVTEDRLQLLPPYGNHDKQLLRPSCNSPLKEKERGRLHHRRNRFSHNNRF